MNDYQLAPYYNLIKEACKAVLYVFRYKRDYTMYFFTIIFFMILGLYIFKSLIGKLWPDTLQK